MSERTFDSLAAKTLKFAASIAFGVPSIASVGCFSFRGFIGPRSIAFSIWFGNVGAGVAFVLKVIECLFAMIALVGNHFLYFKIRTSLLQVHFGCVDRILDGARVASIAVVNLR